MADMLAIDWKGFAADVLAALDGLSVSDSVARWPGTNRALWSRARRGEQPLSAESYLSICRMLGLDPWRRAAEPATPRPPRRRKAKSVRDVLRNVGNQPVTVDVSREAGRARP